VVDLERISPGVEDLLAAIPIRPWVRSLSMNKAFVRDPEEEDDRCPRCGSHGLAVGPETIRAQLPEGAAGPAVPGKPGDGRYPFAESAFYCAYPGCPVAYFDRLRQTVLATLLRRPTYPKRPDAPLCACTGVTSADLARDFGEGSTARIKDLVTRSQSASARCVLEAPDGRPCAAEARKLWMRLRGGG
jgi:hypothetical protein